MKKKTMKKKANEPGGWMASASFMLTPYQQKKMRKILALANRQTFGDLWGVFGEAFVKAGKHGQRKSHVEFHFINHEQMMILKPAIRLARWVNQ